MLTVGASTGNASLVITRGGGFYYDSLEASGTLSVGGTADSTATLKVSDDGYFDTTLDSLNIGAYSGATGVLDVTGPGSQFIEDNYGYHHDRRLWRAWRQRPGHGLGHQRRLRVAEL